MCRQKHFFFVALFLIQTNLYAKDVYNIDQLKGSQSLGKHFDYLIDNTNKIHINELARGEYKGQFQSSQFDSPSFGLSNSYFWVRFELENTGILDRNFLLEVDQPQFDEIEFYTLQEDGNFHETKTGDQLDFASRAIEHWNFVFPIQMESKSSKVFYMRLRMNGPISIPLTLWEKQAFQNYNLERMFFFGTFIGIMLIMFFYNLFFYIGFKEITYLFYVALTFFYIYTFLTFSGLDAQYIFPNVPQYGEYIHHFGIIIANIAAISFVMSFLETKLYLRKIHTFLNVHRIINFFFLFLPFVTEILITIQITVLSILVSLAMVFFTAFLAYRKKLKSSTIFLLASSFAVIGTLIFAGTVISLLPDNLFTRYSAQIGSVLQVLFFSFALSDRINILKNEREAALSAKLIQSEKVASLSRAFERFVPKQFLEYLQKESIASIQLGDNTQQKMCILFCDIRSFTDMSEMMSPDDNFKFINEYLGRVGPYVRSHGGFIDKFIGDAIMALFPSNPEDALDSAISILQEVVRFNEKRKETNQLPIAIGIGIHSGNLMLGTVGEEGRMDGTVISDAVNLASRIEGLTKTLGAALIISQSTWDEISNKEKYNYRQLGEMKVKGKKVAVPLIEIMEENSDLNFSKKIETKVRFEKGIQLYQKGDYVSARNEFTAVIDSFPTDLSSLHYQDLCDREFLSFQSGKNIDLDLGL